MKDIKTVIGKNSFMATKKPLNSKNLTGKWCSVVKNKIK